MMHDSSQTKLSQPEPGKSWFSASELAALELPDVPKRRPNVARKANREGWRSREEVPAGGGKPTAHYHRESLPEAAQRELARRALEQAKAAPEPVVQRAGLVAQVERLAAEKARERSLAQAAELDAAARVRLDAKLVILDAFDRYSAAADSGVVQAREDFCALYNAAEMRLTVAGGSTYDVLDSVSPRTLARWEKQRAKDPARLAGNYGRRSGRRSWSTWEEDEELTRFVVGMLAQHPHASAKHVMRGLRARYERERLPSLRTVQRFIESWRSDNRQLAAYLESPDAWRGRYQSAIGRADASVSALNERWELDSTLADILLLDEDGTERRFALIGGIDLYSRRFRLHVARSSSGRSIGGLLRRMILEFGVPETVVTDEGADYTGEHVTRALALLGIRQDVCPPYTPEAKPHVERAFRTFLHDVVELMPGYVGHSVADRKKINDRRSMAERHAGRRTVQAKMTPAEFQTIADRWCGAIYEQEHHSGIGCTPFQRVAEWITTGMPVKRIHDEEALNVLLAPVGERTVRKNQVSIDGLTYTHPMFAELTGQRVEVRLDDDAGRVYVFDLRTHAFLCVAVQPEIEGLDRAELAKTHKQKQKRFILDAAAEARKLARRMKVDDVAREILDEAAGRARIHTLTPPSDEHTTDALGAASVAARAMERHRTPAAPTELSAEERARAEAMEAEAETRRHEAARRADEEAEQGRAVIHALDRARPAFDDDHDKYLWLLEERRRRALAPDEDAFVWAYEHPYGDDAAEG